MQVAAKPAVLARIVSKRVFRRGIRKRYIGGYRRARKVSLQKVVAEHSLAFEKIAANFEKNVYVKYTLSAKRAAFENVFVYIESRTGV